MTTPILPPNELLPAQLFDVRAMAALLNCSARHIYRLTDSGHMPQPVRLGALVRWRRDSIDAWIAGGCKPVRTPEKGAYQ